MAGPERGAVMMDDDVIVKDATHERPTHCCLFLLVLFILFVLVAVLIGVLVYFLFIRQCLPGLQVNHDNLFENITDVWNYSDILDDNEPWDRLPQTVNPLRYNITITPYFYLEDVKDDHDIFTYDGFVSISIECKERTDHVFLHALDINISHISFVNTQVNSSGNLIQSYEMDYYYQVVKLYLTGNISVGATYMLDIDYKGFINQGLYGFYRTSYKENGKERWGGVTQMEPTSARKALPCFDEPNFKAEFDVTIRHRPDMNALSNGIELYTNDLGGNMSGWKETVFKTTPKMSTYLLALAVTHFVSLNTTTASGTMIRVWSKPQSITFAQYALETAVKHTEFFSKMFDYEYHLEKQDMLAVSNFENLGMENWGLIIYLESAMIHNPQVDTVIQKEEVATLVAHELAHQWFGNLVSPIWWNDLWLNEGFATYWANAAVDYSEPTWDVKSYAFIDTSFGLMAYDRPGISSAVRKYANSPDEIYEMFSFSTYNKGAALIRMLVDIIGEDIFMSGIRQYLKQYAFDNVNTDDLWNALTKADISHGGHDVKHMMDGWTLQRFYPVVTMERIQDTGKINVSQSVYLTHPENERLRTRYENSSWEIPITHTHKSDHSIEGRNRSWLHGHETGEFQLSNGIQPNDWYLANIGCYGYYRINYDVTNWNRLAQQLMQNHTIISTESRFKILDDAASMFKTNALDIQVLLDLTLYLDKETEYLPLKAASSIMRQVHSVIKMQPSYSLLRTYWLQKLSSLYKLYGWPDKTKETIPKTEHFRYLLIKEACKFGNEHCLQTAKDMFARLMSNATNNPVNILSLRRLVYCYAIAEGGDQEWQFAFEQLQSVDGHHQLDWLYGLCCSREAWRLNKLLLDTHSGEIQIDWASNGFNAAVDYMAAYDTGLHVAWDYVQTNWKDIWDDYNDYYYYSYDDVKDDNEETDPKEAVYLDELFEVLSRYLTLETHLQQLLDMSETYESEIDVFSEPILRVKDNIKKVTDFADKARLWLEQHV